MLLIMDGLHLSLNLCSYYYNLFKVMWTGMDDCNFNSLIKFVLLSFIIQRYGFYAKLKDLAPKMKEIQIKYQDDKQKTIYPYDGTFKKIWCKPNGWMFTINFTNSSILCNI